MWKIHLLLKKSALSKQDVFFFLQDIPKLFTGDAACD